MTPHYINPHHFLCTIEASAGTYIKEFIHGDLGRTQPNMGELLVCFSSFFLLLCRIVRLTSYNWT